MISKLKVINKILRKKKRRAREKGEEADEIYKLLKKKKSKIEKYKIVHCDIKIILKED